MALLHFGKKNEEKNAPACACSCGSSERETVKETGSCCGKAVNGICCIQVLGAGCKSCHEMKIQGRRYRQWAYRQRWNTLPI